jgi:hypothetical protein
MPKSEGFQAVVALRLRPPRVLGVCLPCWDELGDIRPSSAR